VVCGTCSKEGHASGACWQKTGKPEWANQMAQPGLRRVAELEAQAKELTGKLAAVQASFASMAREPAREDNY
jgi:molecular chaperone GrpE (heat shock protein)